MNAVTADQAFSAECAPVGAARDDTAGTFTFRHARIPHMRAAEYAARLEALALEFIAEPRNGDVEYGLYLALFPTNRIARIPAGTDTPTPELAATEPSP